MSNWHVLSCSYGSCVNFKVLGKRCEVKSVNHESYLFSLLQAFPIRKICHSISSLNVFSVDILFLQLRLYADSLTQGAKDFLLLLFLNCSEVYGNRRPLDGTDADLIKLYDKTGFEQSKDSDMIRYKLQYKNRKACEIPYAFFFLQKK